MLLWSDDEQRDVLARDSEVPLEVGDAAGEVTGQAAGDEVAIGAECFRVGDLGRVGVFRGSAGLPCADLRSAVVFLAFVDAVASSAKRLTIESMSRSVSRSK